MKKITLLVLIAVTFFACTKNKTVRISGKVTNPLTRNIVLQIGEKTDTVSLSDDNTFIIEKEIKDEQLAYFNNGLLRISLYLIPGTNINMNFDTEDFRNNTISDSIFSGTGAEPSAFIISLRGKSLKESMYELFEMPVKKFQTKLDDAYKNLYKEIEKFSANNSSSEKFIETIKLLTDIDFATKRLYYIKYHPQYAPNDKTPIPDSFYDFFDKVLVPQYHKFKDIQVYENFIFSYSELKISNGLKTEPVYKKGTVAYAQKRADLIAELNIVPEIKDQFGIDYLRDYSIVPDSIQKVYAARYKDLLQSKENINDFEETIAAVKKIKPGSVAPSFSYPDLDGKMVSSETFKGNVVYILVWAAWSAPSRSAILSFERLKAELSGQPISFVSISIDEDKTYWKEMMEEKKLQGYHLFAEGVLESGIAKSYAIKGIPRLIIIDKEGKIVNTNAPRPSKPETKEKLLELAKE